MTNTTMMSTDARLVHSRIIFFKNKRKKLLSLKKKDRTESLQSIDDTISRLKRWMKAL